MTRTQAIARINQGLGFRSLDSTIIISMLQEAQRDLEKGKTLPNFLIVQDATFTLLADTHSVALPAGFIRLYDDNLPHFTPVNTNRPRFLKEVGYMDGVQAQFASLSTETKAPSVFAVRATTLDFITSADLDYSFTWSYYAKDAVLSSDVENLWLANQPEWLIGETGMRLAKDLRDPDAYAIFQEMQQKGRAAEFGELLVDETGGGPIQMGANL